MGETISTTSIQGGDTNGVNQITLFPIEDLPTTGIQQSSTGFDPRGECQRNSGRCIDPRKCKAANMCLGA